MPSVHTIEGSRDGAWCKRVRTGKKGGGCTIELCRGSRGRWKFQKGTRRCR